MDYLKGKHERLAIRISVADKQHMATVAKRRGLTLAEFVRNAASRAAGARQ